MYVVVVGVLAVGGVLAPPASAAGLPVEAGRGLSAAHSAQPSGRSVATLSAATAAPTCSVAANVGRDPYSAALAAFRNGTWYIRGTRTSGPADLCFVFGQAGDQPVVGDWNGDGIPTPGVFRPSTGTWYLSNSIFAQSGADIVVRYGSPGDVAYPGDWNNDNIDSVGIFRPATHTFYLRNENSSGIADGVFTVGNPGDQAEWGAGFDGNIAPLELYRPSTATWYELSTNGSLYDSFVFGVPGDIPQPGPGIDNIGVLGGSDGGEGAGVYRRSSNQWILQTIGGLPIIVLQFGDPGDIHLGLRAWRGYNFD